VTFAPSVAEKAPLIDIKVIEEEILPEDKAKIVA